MKYIHIYMKCAGHVLLCYSVPGMQCVAEEYSSHHLSYDAKARDTTRISLNISFYYSGGAFKEDGKL